MSLLRRRARTMRTQSAVLGTAGWTYRRRRMEPVPKYRFERMVVDALDDLPEDLLPVLDNVVVQIHDRNRAEPTLLGLYDGVPHTERTGMEGPDIVSIYRLALCEMCEDEDDLADEVYVTVIHEIAHAAGIDDERLHQLGWA